MQGCLIYAAVLTRVVIACLFAFFFPAFIVQARGEANYGYVTITSHGVPLRIWLEKTGNGQPILLIHGFGSNSYTWRKITRELSKTHQVLALDLKGSGRSDKPRDDRYSLLDQVDVVKTLLDELNIRNVTIIGHSFGGGVALALTEQLNRNNRGRVARLVLIASMAYPQQLPRFVELLRMPLISAVGISVIPAETQAYEALKESMLYPQRLSAADIKEYARALTDPDGRYAILKSAEQLVPDNFDQIIKLYRTVHQPSLLIWCRDDRVVPLWVGRKLAGDLPNSRLAIFPNCGHLVQEEVPEKAVLEIRRFLSTSR